MAVVEVSNTFLIGVVVAFVVIRVICDCTKDTHMRPKVPSDVQFTAARVQNFVQTPDGQVSSLADFIDQLCLHGDQLAAIVEPIRVVYERSRWWTLDNRRLYALRKAEERGAISLLRHTVLNLDEAVVRAEYRSKQCSVNQGKTAGVSVDPGFRWGPEYELKA